MWHLIFITLHALSAIAGFALGISVLLTRSTSERRGRQRLRAHTLAIAGMAGALPFSLAVGWAGFSEAVRPVFLGLFPLALYMFWRARRAERAYQEANRVLVIDHVGFNVIALSIGFFAVLVLRLGAGWPGILAVVVGLVVLGHLVLRRLKTASSRPSGRRVGVG
jgi:hypothetical protein